MKTTQRLKAHTEQDIIKNVLKQYVRHHITPLHQTFPVLSYQDNWFVYKKGEPFEHLIKRTVQDWIKYYPDSSYQQLQQKAKQRQLTPEENHEIKSSIDLSNQRLKQDNDKRNEDRQRWYKELRNNYLKHPFKAQKPDKNDYRPLPFQVSDSPFTVSAVLAVLGQMFQTLHETQIFNNFAYRPHIQGDKDQLTLHNQLNTQTAQLAREHEAAQSRSFEIQSKEAELKRKLEQLKHLTQITQGYNELPDTEGLTSPSEQIAHLEKLLAEKRRR